MVMRFVNGDNECTSNVCEFIAMISTCSSAGNKGNCTVDV